MYFHHFVVLLVPRTGGMWLHCTRILTECASQSVKLFLTETLMIHSNLEKRLEHVYHFTGFTAGTKQLSDQGSSWNRKISTSGALVQHVASACFLHSLFGLTR